MVGKCQVFQPSSPSHIVLDEARAHICAYWTWEREGEKSCRQCLHFRSVNRFGGIVSGFSSSVRGGVMKRSGLY
jgi:hypothetical protein